MTRVRDFSSVRAWNATDAISIALTKVNFSVSGCRVDLVLFLNGLFVMPEGAAVGPLREVSKKGMEDC